LIYKYFIKILIFINIYLLNKYFGFMIIFFFKFYKLRKELVFRIKNKVKSFYFRDFVFFIFININIFKIYIGIIFLNYFSFNNFLYNLK
jgi:hypothetical protein